MRIVLIALTATLVLFGCGDPTSPSSNDEEGWELTENSSSVPTDCPDPDDPDVGYVETDPDECAGIDINCGPDGSSFYDEDCGCGCRPRDQSCEIDDCPDGEYCYYDDGVCGDEGAEGVCRPVPVECTDDVTTVCGCDGRVYTGSSTCAAQHDGGVDVHSDTATCEDSTDPDECIDPTTGDVADGHCHIDGECFDAEQARPDEACEVCDPDESQHAWTPINNCFNRVTTGLYHSCAVTTEDELHCWPHEIEGDRADAPDGAFTEVSIGHFHTCAIDDQKRVECWGSEHDSLTDAPDIGFRQLSAARWYTCGVDEYDQATCWGRTFLEHGQNNPPSELFDMISTSTRYACGISVSGQLSCWGADNHDLTDPPDDQFVDLTTAPRYACAIDEADTLQCWGDDVPAADPPSGTYITVSAAADHACAVDTAGQLDCWGIDSDDGKASAPDGEFWDVSAGRDHTCGVDTSGRLVCWGDPELSDPPAID